LNPGHVQIGAGRYADQKYLDEWPTRFEGVCVLPHKGLNVAIWNLQNYHVGMRAGKETIDDEPLLVYHFHGLKRVRPTVYYPALHGTKLTTTIKQRIYAPYIRTLIEAHLESSRVLQGIPLLPTLEEQSSVKRSTRAVSWPRWAARQADRWLNVIGKVHSRRYFVVVNGHAPEDAHYPMTIEGTIGRWRFGMVHNLDARRQRWASNFDVVIHGHTHRWRDEVIGRTRFINPGALHRASSWTVALLDCSSDQLRMLPVIDTRMGA